jgi:hypothetical protein
VEEGILDVELMYRKLDEGLKVSCSPKREQGRAQREPGQLDDGVEGLVVVHSGALSEAPKDPTGLVAIEGAVRGQLVAKKPLACDHVSAWWTRHQVPGVVGQQGHVLFLHRATLVGAHEGSANKGGDLGGVWRSVSRISCQNQPVNEAKNADCAPSHHQVDVLEVAVDADQVVHTGAQCGLSRRRVAASKAYSRR